MKKNKPKQNLIYCPYCGNHLLFKWRALTQCSRCKKIIEIPPKEEVKNKLKER